jgi:transposase-like protein
MKLPKLLYSSPDSQRLFCPRCPRVPPGSGPPSRRFVRFGSFYRTSDRAWIARFRCADCHATFSRATHHPCFAQKKRQLNSKIWHLLQSEVSHRRTALILGISRKTVDRKIRFLGENSRLELSRILKDRLLTQGAFIDVQFDEMESFEHTKCKPVSIPLVVDAKTRLILGIEACSMPAHGPLAEISRRRYGPRPNHRPQALRRVLRSIRPWVHPAAQFRSDSHPYYPPALKEVFPKAIHHQEKGRRSSLGGQGELKKIGKDPIFSLNHTAAMYRANVCRLIRKTWCTTKRIDRLRDHLAMYAHFHNLRILAALPPVQQATGPV